MASHQLVMSVGDACRPSVGANLSLRSSGTGYCARRLHRYEVCTTLGV